MHKSLFGGWHSKLIDKQPDQYGEVHRHTSSLDMLSETMEQIELQLEFLTGLVYRLANEPGSAKDDSITILRNPREIADYVYRNKAACVMFTSPKHIPVVLKHQELGWVKDPDEFADWLMIYWTPETLVVAVP